MEKLQEWMSEKVYGLNGTKDKTLKIRGNPKVFFETTMPPTTLPTTNTPTSPHYYVTTLLPCSLPRSSST